MLANFINEAISNYDISAKYLQYDKKDNAFWAEMSDLPPFDLKKELIIINPRTGNTRIFKHYDTDMDSTQEDTYGWRYRSDDGIELLIIND